jgi:probable rRNA maturation factor
VSRTARKKRTSSASRTRQSRQRDTILNRQRTLRIPVRQLEEFLARARRKLRLPPGSLTVCLVTNAEIARWNRAYRHKDGPTDVLSFPADDEPPPRAHKSSPRIARRASASPNRYLGDIAIAPAVARRNARRFGRTFSQEMRILTLHGILHLLGYDHETDSGQMDRRERRLRRELGLAAPIRRSIGRSIARPISR